MNAVTRIRRGVLGVANALDRAGANVGLRFERPALLSFLFHSVFDSRAEIERDLAYPQEAFTTDALRALIDHLSTAGYRFVGVSDLEHGLEEGGRYACLTFDDGYASNLRLLPILREHGVPASVFVSTGYVERARRFWWDTLYVERRRRGQAREVVERELEWLKRQPHARIEAYLEEQFGVDAAKPRSDVDRPLTPGELRELAAEPLVTIGNHTVDHVLLTSVDPTVAREQLVGATRYLESVIGEAPSALAYPNGNVDDTVLGVVRELGATCAFTVLPRAEPVPPPPDRLLELGRFRLDGRRSVREQIDVTRSRFQVANAGRRIGRRLRMR